MINKLKASQINGLNKLPPKEWNYDYEVLLRDFINEDYFHAFVQIQDNKIVGTGNVFLKGTVGWLANIIVDKNQRRKGLGFKMTEFLVDFLKHKGCETQLLIATELGEPVYKKLGFKKLTEYQCFDSIKDNNSSVTNSSIQRLKTADLDSVYQLDSAINGEDRRHLLHKYWNNGLGFFNKDNALLGFYLPEFGRGLVLSRDEQAGIELLKVKHSKKGKRTLLPIENQTGIRFLEKMNLKKGVSCSRMLLGKENNWEPHFIYSYGSGYCG